MLKPTDRCQRVLLSEASISASITPQVERLLQVRAYLSIDWQLGVMPVGLKSFGLPLHACQQSLYLI